MSADKYPRTVSPPASHDVVQVLMTEEMARVFELRCLGSNTRGFTKLSEPMEFSEDDVATYTIEVGADTHSLSDGPRRSGEAL
jgi:hypothetical protein